MADNPALTRRRLLGLFGAAAALPVLSACGSSVGGGSGGGHRRRRRWRRRGQGRPGRAPVRGVRRARHGHAARLGALAGAATAASSATTPVETVIADEGETPQTGVPAVQKVLQSDSVDVVVGLVNSATALGVGDLLRSPRSCSIVTNAGADDVTGKARTPYIWRTSFTNAQISAAMGTHLAQSGFTEGVYAIAPDYAAGTEVIAGLQEGVRGRRRQGRRRGQAGRSARPRTTSRSSPASSSPGPRPRSASSPAPRRSRSSSSTSSSGWPSTIPLYGSGFLTEGSVLAQQGDAALGRADHAALHRPARQPGQQGLRRAPTGPSTASRPSCFSVQTYDAAQRAEPGARHGAPRSTATRWPRRSAASARSTTARAARGPSTGRPRGRTSTCARSRTSAGTLVNAVVPGSRAAEPARSDMLGQRPQRRGDRLPAVHPGGRAVAGVRHDGRAQPGARRAVPRRRLPRRVRSPAAAGRGFLAALAVAAVGRAGRGRRCCR